MISDREPKSEMTQTPTSTPKPTPAPTPAETARAQFEEIKEALIGPKLDDPNQGKKIWILPNPDPKTNFSKP